MKNPRHIRFITHILPAIAWAALIFILSSRAGRDDDLPPIFPHFDKVAHLGAYAVLGLLLTRSGRRNWTLSPCWIWVVVCMAVGSLYGASDEWHQSFVIHRTSSAADWAFDTLGAILGVAYWIARFRVCPGLRIQA